MNQTEIRAHIDTPPSPPDPALVADVRRFFASASPDTGRERRINSWRDDANPSTSAAVADMLRHDWRSGLVNSIAKNLVERLES